MATTKIKAGYIDDEAVGTAQLAANSVTAAKIADGILTTQTAGITTNLSAGQTTLNISSSSKVGIGETSPDKHLHIKNTATGDTGIVIENTNNAQNLDIDFYNNVGSAQGRIRYAEGAGSFDINPNVSGSSPLSISYAGIVTKAAQPSFNVNEPAVTSGGGNTIIFGSERHDTGSNYNTSTGVFTAPVAGVYQFHVYILMEPGNNQYGRVLFRINDTGSNMEKYGDNLTYVAGDIDYFGLGLSANIYMAATDNIRVFNSGQWPTYGTSYGAFSGMLIG